MTSRLDFKLRLFDSLSHSNTVVTEIPIALSYRWEILKYIRNFDLDSFTGAAEEYYEILLSAANSTKQSFLTAVIDIFFDGDPATFFSAYNLLSGITNLLSASGTIEEKIENYALQIYNDCIANGTTLYQRLYDEFLEEIALEDTLNNLATVFQPWFGLLDLDNLSSIIYPQVDLSIGNATTSVGIALEFPRTILIPLDINGNQIVAPATSALSVTAESLDFGTDTGIQIQGQTSLTLDYSEIPGTGFKINASTGKIDVSSVKNIYEADVDGRPKTFNGVYFESIVLELPDAWSQATSGSDNLVATDVLIGTEGGFSGNIALDPAGTNGKLEFDAFGLTFNISKFDVTFHQNSIIALEGVGKILLPFLSDNGNPAEIDVFVAWDDQNDQYHVEVDSSSLPPLQFGAFDVAINTFSFTFTDGAISNFELALSLSTDALKGNMAGTLPGTIDLDISYDGQQFTLALDTNQMPLFLLNNWELTIVNANIVLDGNFNLQSWNFNSILRIPQLKENTNTNPKDVAVTLSYDGTSNPKVFKLMTGGINDIKLFNMDLDIVDVLVEFQSTNGSSTLETFEIEFDLEIQGLEDGGSPTEINGIFGYAAGSYSASVSLTSQPSWDLFGATFNPSAFSIAFNDNTLTAFALSGDLIVNQLKDANNSSQTLPIALTIGYDGSNYSASAYPVPDMELGGLTVHDTDIEVEFSNSGNLNKFHLEGDIRHDSFRDANDDPVWASYEIDYDDVNQEYSVTVQNVSFTMMGADVVLNLFTFEFDHNSVNLIQATGTINIDSIKDANGNATTIALDLMIIDKFDFYVKAAVSGGVPLKVPNVVEFTLYDLTIGRESGVWYIRFGSPPGLPQEGMMADILLDIPVLSKFIPEQIGVYSLKLDQNLNTSDENIFMKWEALDGLEVQGGANGITVSIPMQLSIFDVINVDGIKISFNNGDLKLTMSGNILLGPLVGTIKDVGINLNFLDATGNGNSGRKLWSF